MWTWIESDYQPLPLVERADVEGLVAVGGRLTSERLEEAYRKGIYPWFSEDAPVMWWSPDPRMVLYPQELHIPKSMRPFLNQQRFKLTVNADFTSVIKACAEMSRPDQDETWIVDDMIDAYVKWHEEGFVHSFEAWDGDELVGGLYGVSMGGVFFGESMFAKVPNASKYAFIQAVKWMYDKGIQIIDCQMETEHLKRFGARKIDRTVFIQEVEDYQHSSAPNWKSRTLVNQGRLA